MINKKILFGVVTVLVIVGLLIGGYFALRSPWEYRGDEAIKIFWLNSYDDYSWTLDQIKGFESVFDAEGIDIEVKQFNMDTKRISSEEWSRIASEARNEIIEWGPDLIYATDDNAQRYVGKDFAGGNIPWVFSGVNAEEDEYYSEDDENVAGVLERYPIESLVDFIRTLFPYAKNIVVINDNSPSGASGIKWIKSQEGKMPDMNFIYYDLIDSFAEFQEKVRESQSTADVIIFRGLDTLEDESGVVLSEPEVTEWFIKNNDIPEVSFFDYQVEYGALAAVIVSGIEQGEAAGILAKEILIDGQTPSDMKKIVPRKGDTFINLARAESLGIDIKQRFFDSWNVGQTDFNLLWNEIEVVDSFPWEKDE